MATAIGASADATARQTSGPIRGWSPSPTTMASNLQRPGGARWRLAKRWLGPRASAGFRPAPCLWGEKAGQVGRAGHDESRLQPGGQSVLDRPGDQRPATERGQQFAARSFPVVTAARPGTEHGRRHTGNGAGSLRCPGRSTTQGTSIGYDLSYGGASRQTSGQCRSERQLHHMAPARRPQFPGRPP